MKKGKFIPFAIASLMAFSLSSCSAFFGDDGYMITDISWVNDEKTGFVVVTIKTTSEENPEVIFRIPQGIAGVPGVGIKNITSDTNQVDGKTEVTITITYTDETLSPTVMTFPLSNGQDGKGIASVEVNNDPSGDLILQFVYTDGSKSQPIVIPRGIDGKDGVDGVGIQNVSVDDSDPTKVVVTITFTDGNLPPQVIELPKGVGIASVRYDEKGSTDEVFVLTVTYTDGYVEKIRLPRPTSVEWITGTGDPSASAGKDGDFYLNTVSGFVYKKVGKTWMFLFSMKGTGSAVEFVVKFHPNQGIWDEPQLKDGAVYSVPVKYGEYISLNHFPSIHRDGYTFEGWKTDVSGNPNAGQFTDLTPVLRDMNLYASWSAN